MNYPNLSGARVIAVDCETHDPQLLDKGPGMYRKDGRVLGVSISDGEFSEYYNLAHYDVKAGEREANIQYLRDVLGNAVPKIGANLMYDLDWLENGEGIKVNGRFHDVQIAEPLINEYEKTNLNSLGLKYTKRGKEKSAIDKFCSDNGLSGDARKHMARMPYAVVREYARQDAMLPIEVFGHQYPIMKDRELLEVYEMEMGLFPLLLQMRREGARVDTQYIHDQKLVIEAILFQLKQDLYQAVGWAINPNSSRHLARVFQSLGFGYSETEKGNPSIGKDALENIDHPTIQLIVKIRKLEKTLSSFFINSFTDCAVVDRIHTLFHPMKTDDSGTVSGRLSSSAPNLQQIPARDKVIGPMCRRAFIPNDGCIWGKLDFSQIEYRVLAHYAVGGKANDVRARYNADPNTDYHQMIMELTGLERKPAKNCNFGFMNGMGIDKAARMFGWSDEYAREIFSIYHGRAPYVKKTMHTVADAAIAKGYIYTIMKRRAHLMDKNKAYVMFNRLIQGSAADIMKKSMVDAYKAGVFNVLAPHLTVHDELDVSVPRTREGAEALLELKHIMQTCVKLKVPIIADLEVGKNWTDLVDLNNPTVETIMVAV